MGPLLEICFSCCCSKRAYKWILFRVA